jgi:DNA-binding transcriptional ArsR family regulator
MAKPGFGKRAVPGQGPHRADDFAHLPKREAAIAAYIDRLPDGAAIGIKDLARQLDYGQCAIGTALRRLAEAGHLRRLQEPLDDGRWVTRTHFSRAPRSSGWWAAFHEGRDLDDREAEPDVAYNTLARLGEADARMTLSARDCAKLRALAAEWFERGATPQQVTAALTSGLPSPVHCPRELARRRLTDKLLPVRRAERPTPRLMVCVVCGAPGRAETLPGGVCGGCCGGRPVAARPTADVHGHAAAVRSKIAARAG